MALTVMNLAESHLYPVHMLPATKKQCLKHIPKQPQNRTMWVAPETKVNSATKRLVSPANKISFIAWRAEIGAYGGSIDLGRLVVEMLLYTFINYFEKHNNYMYSYYMHSPAIIEQLCALFLHFELVANSSFKRKTLPIFRKVSTSSILIPKMSRQTHLAWNCLRLLGPKIFLWRSESLAKKRSINAWCS